MTSVAPDGWRKSGALCGRQCAKISSDKREKRKRGMRVVGDFCREEAWL
jgi:hypothetical protein